MNSRKLRVIVYEDNPEIAELLSQFLEGKGYDVISFQDPTFCPTYSDMKSECIHTKPCTDVIISDYNMPKVTGVEFLKTQKELGCKVPFENKAIITGAVLNQETKDLIDSLGCKLFKKPFKLAEILAWLETCAERIGNIDTVE